MKRHGQVGYYAMFYVRKRILLRLFHILSRDGEMHSTSLSLKVHMNLITFEYSNTDSGFECTFLYDCINSNFLRDFTVLHNNEPFLCVKDDLIKYNNQDVKDFEWDQETNQDFIRRFDIDVKVNDASGYALLRKTLNLIEKGKWEYTSDFPNIARLLYDFLTGNVNSDFKIDLT